MKTTIKDLRRSFAVSHDNLLARANQQISAGHIGSSVIIPNICHDIAVFDYGIGKMISEVFPLVKENFSILPNTKLIGYAGHVQYCNVKQDKKYRNCIIVANIIHPILSKKRKRILNYGILIKAMQDISSHIQKIKKDTDTTPIILTNKIGTGYYGGNWSFISDIIDDVWPNISVTVFPECNKK